MARILIIEFLLGAVLGAVVFRLAWGFTRSRRVAWVVVGLIAMAVALLGTRTLEFPQYWGHSKHWNARLVTLAFGLDRALAWLAGGAFASFAGFRPGL